MKLKRLLPLFLLLPSQGLAIELAAVEKAVTEMGFKSNYARLAKDTYYGARKRYEFDAEFAVEVFFNPKTSQKISQIRFTAKRCLMTNTAKMSESEFKSKVQTDYLTSYKGIFRSEPPQQFSNFLSEETEKVTAVSQSYKSVAYRSGTPKCDSGLGTIHHIIFYY